MENQMLDFREDIAKVREISDRLLQAPAVDEPDQQKISELRNLPTSNLFRLLRLKNLNPTESANLVAYIQGIPLDPKGHQTDWTLKDVNRVLFLRSLYTNHRVAVE